MTSQINPSTIDGFKIANNEWLYRAAADSVYGIFREKLEEWHPLCKSSYKKENPLQFRFSLQPAVWNHCFPSEKGTNSGYLRNPDGGNPLVGLAKQGDEKDPNLSLFEREMNDSTQPLQPTPSFASYNNQMSSLEIEEKERETINKLFLSNVAKELAKFSLVPPGTVETEIEYKQTLIIKYYQTF